jgi:hypothetical protein
MVRGEVSQGRSQGLDGDHKQCFHAHVGMQPSQAPVQRRREKKDSPETGPDRERYVLLPALAARAMTPPRHVFPPVFETVSRGALGGCSLGPFIAVCARLHGPGPNAVSPRPDRVHGGIRALAAIR